MTTALGGGLMNVLKNQCGISQAFDLTSGGILPAITQYDAIWDTGATNSVITQAVIDACGLVATGMSQVHGVHGEQQRETHLVNIYLPNNMVVGGIRVTSGELIGADVLIGMDVINLGDFAVTNFKGQTKFTFRFPSKAHIDFVQEYNREQFMAEFHHGGGSKARPILRRLPPTIKLRASGRDARGMVHGSLPAR